MTTETAQKERPILFSAPMVTAILAKLKTQTRRTVKGYLITGPNPPNDSTFDVYGGDGWAGAFGSDGRGNATQLCPFGVPGDHLWVRETWRPHSWREDNPIMIEFSADGGRMEDRSGKFEAANYEEWYEGICISATDECATALESGHPGLLHDGESYSWSENHSPLKWRPSIYMPRWASRITLEITGIRVERVQDISEADATAEGITKDEAREYVYTGHSPSDEAFAAAYGDLWNRINGKREGCAWKDNPWVWVVEFKRLTASVTSEPLQDAPQRTEA